jgi:hypothetical protein
LAGHVFIAHEATPSVFVVQRGQGLRHQPKRPVM